MKFGRSYIDSFSRDYIKDSFASLKDLSKNSGLPGHFKTYIQKKISNIESLIEYSEGMDKNS